MSNITQFTTGGVKSIQRGVYTTVTTSGSPANVVITISAVNPAKVMVILAGGYQYSANNIINELISVTATTLTIYGPFWYYSAGGTWQGAESSWQVVEYY